MSAERVLAADHAGDRSRLIHLRGPVSRPSSCAWIRRSGKWCSPAPARQAALSERSCSVTTGRRLERRGCIVGNRRRDRRRRRGCLVFAGPRHLASTGYLGSSAVWPGGMRTSARSRAQRVVPPRLFGSRPRDSLPFISCSLRTRRVAPRRFAESWLQPGSGSRLPLHGAATRTAADPSAITAVSSMQLTRWQAGTSLVLARCTSLHVFARGSAIETSGRSTSSTQIGRRNVPGGSTIERPGRRPNGGPSYESRR
jgi:hypothetical protein